jgi:hypothetical protein
MNSNITREGITADLEAMARVGIGGVLIMEVAYGEPTGPVAVGSPQWRELYRFMLDEAHRLGIAVEMNSGMGWAGTGGPWIPPELAMQKLTTSEIVTQGSKRFDGALPQPPMVSGFYRDIAVLAFPTPPGDDVNMADYSPKASAGVSAEKLNPQRIIDGNPHTTLDLPRPEPNQPQWVQLEFSRPFTARSLTLSMVGNPKFGVHGSLEVSDDGRVFRTVRGFSGQPPTMMLNFPETTAGRFRLQFTRAIHPKMDLLRISGLELGQSFRIENIALKAAFIAAQTTPERNIPPRADWPAAPPSQAIPRDRIVDLTPSMGKDGRLVWDLPEGKWTILRIGHTLTGAESHPAPKSGIGPECDKLSKEAVQAGFAGLLGRLITGNPGLAGKTLVSTHIDSWEVGSQNWTPRMRQEFQRLRGYDLWKFLPVITGRVVDSLEVSERFLWDLRQTVSDLVRLNYAGELRRLANEHGLRLSIEGYFNCPTDEIAYGGQADDPMAEFWWSPRAGLAWSCQEMTSAAHVYGKRLVPAESFTSGDQEKWQGHPGNLKEVGDWAFCQGINQFVFHRYAMQPWSGRQPGMGMGKWGVHYERTQTWWEQSKPWHEYLARCQSILQQGLFVADVCVLEPEGTIRFTPPASVQPAGAGERPGYNFDTCSPEVVLTRMTVRNGWVVLPDGMSYRVLLLPETPTMTPRLLRKIKELADAGATVIGPKVPPAKSPGLTDYLKGDAEAKQLAKELWDSGKIVTNKTPAEVLAGQGVPPDFSSRNRSGEENVRFTHRTIGTTEVYFLANKKNQVGEAICSFRLQGKRPELWNPETGRIERVAVYDEAGGCVRMPIRFDPSGSVFVVFRSDSPVEPDRITSVVSDGKVILDTGHKEAASRATDNSRPTMPAITLTRNDKGEVEAAAWQAGVYTLKTADGKTKRIEVAPLLPPQEIAGPWEVSFDPKWGGPGKPVIFESLADWSKWPEAGIRYYSGTATYRKSFRLADQSSIRNPKSRTFLDLGRLAVIAEAKLNGKNLGILWKPPFCVDITGALKPGENSLEVTVTNLWVNRQIGDEQLPEDSDRQLDGTFKGSLKEWPRWLLDGKPSPTGRYTFTTWRLWKKDDPLAESGLLGPVVLRTMARVVIGQRS